MREHSKSLIQRVPAIMTPLLVVAFSATLAKLLWVVLAPPEDVIAAPKLNTPAPLQQPQSSNLGKVIADTHLFGQVKREAPVARRTMPAPVQKIEEPAEPPIEVSLHGIWSSKRAGGRTGESYKTTPIVEPKLDAVSQIQADLGALFGDPDSPVSLNVNSKKGKSFAIMSLSDGEQKMYSERDLLADDVKVLEIFADKVVLDNRGIRQELFLGDSSKPEAKTKKAIPKAVSANLAAARAQRQNAPPVSSESRGGETLGQRDLRKLREDIVNDASLLTQYTAPEPLLIDGQVKGYRLHLSNRLRLLYQTGFRPGDVVTELNGVRLSDPSTIQQTLYDFVSSDQLAISVLRGQNEETFRYSF